MPLRARRLSKLQIERRRNWKLPVIIICCVLLTVAVLTLALYFIMRNIHSKFYFCTQSAKFIPIEEVCDGKVDCDDKEDELNCVSRLSFNTTHPVRLVGDSLILQVFLGDKTWSTVCADNWRTQHTRLSCNQLGYTQSPRSFQVPVKGLPPNLKSYFSALSSKANEDNNGIQNILSVRDQCNTSLVVSLSCSDCGEVVGEDRIVGGTDTSIESWPWQVSLQWDAQHVCGGSLISTRWIVSAAHCFTGRTGDLSMWRVVLGHTYLTTSGAISVDTILFHEGYNHLSNDYDLAMVRLAQDVTPGDTIHPVCLPPYQLSVKEGEELVVTGWGMLHEEGDLATVLQKATVPLINRAACSNATIYGSGVTPRMLCAGFLKGGVDSCQGDSGGPLVYLSSRWYLIGVVSWGTGCARKGHPGVYTDVRQLLDWIYHSMNVSV